MQLHSSIVSLSCSLIHPHSHSHHHQNIISQSSSPRPHSPTTFPPQPSTASPHLVHPPTNDEIDAVIQQATSSVSSDGRHVPLKDTRTQLFVGNVRLFVPLLSLALVSLSLYCEFVLFFLRRPHSSHPFMFCILFRSIGDSKRALVLVASRAQPWRFTFHTLRENW